MNGSQANHIKRIFLYLLIVSVNFSAILGIVALLAGSDFGWVEIRILLTTVTLTGASICGLACGVLWERGRGRVLAIPGIALAIVSAALLIAGMWIEVGSDGYWKTAVSLTVLAVAAAHLSLLSLARLATQFAWAWVGAYLSIIGLALMLNGMIIVEELGDETMLRIVGVTAIIAASFSVLIPIFHRLSKTTPALRSAYSPATECVPAEGEESIDAEIARLQKRIAELEARRRR
jgi:hypothetical protein